MPDDDLKPADLCAMPGCGMPAIAIAKRPDGSLRHCGVPHHEAWAKSDEKSARIARIENEKKGT